MKKIGKRSIGLDQLFFVVEEGQFNLGDFSQAMRMIRLAAETGADAIEFQLAYADDFYIKSHPGHAIYKEREFSDQQLKELIDVASQQGLELIVTPLSDKIVAKMAAFGCSAFNINASDLNNPSMLRAVMDSGLPFFLSIALASEAEVDWVLRFIQRYAPAAEFTMLHGQHTMASGEHGVCPEHTSLGYLGTLSKRLGTSVGFVDHTPYEWFPACAVAAGASIVTKHMAPSHELRGPDWPICLDPEEMKRSISMARNVYRSIREQAKVLAPGEYMDRSEMRRSIVADKDMEAGHVLQRGDFVFKRPGTGLPPDQEDAVMGSVLVKAVKKDEAISLDILRR
jgi:sialic acid synthase SpsE